MPETRPSAPSSSLPPSTAPHSGAWIPHGFQLDPHSHAEGQLVYAAAGALATTTERGTWVAPAHRVTWTPPGFEHAHRCYGTTDARLVTVPVDLCGELVTHPSVFAVGPLLREALLALTGTAMECGWSNPSSFIDVFTEIVGQTPGRYQDELRNRRS